MKVVTLDGLGGLGGCGCGCSKTSLRGLQGFLGLGALSPASTARLAALESRYMLLARQGVVRVSNVTRDAFQDALVAIRNAPDDATFDAQANALDVAFAEAERSQQWLTSAASSKSTILTVGLVLGAAGLGLLGVIAYKSLWKKRAVA